MPRTPLLASLAVGRGEYLPSGCWAIQVGRGPSPALIAPGAGAGRQGTATAGGGRVVFPGPAARL